MNISTNYYKSKIFNKNSTTSLRQSLTVIFNFSCKPIFGSHIQQGDARKGGRNMSKNIAIATLKKNGYPIPTAKQVATLLLFGTIIHK